VSDGQQDFLASVALEPQERNFQEQRIVVLIVGRNAIVAEGHDWLWLWPFSRGGLSGVLLQ